MTGKVILIQGEGLGRGDDKLGQVLMANFLRLLSENDKKPSQLVFWNAGVKLCCDGALVLDHLRKLEGLGVELLACTTCLEYYDLKERMVVGKPTTMGKSIAAMMNEDTVSL